MPIRYYPSSKVVTNLSTSGGQFISQDNSDYKGKYYVTYDGQYFAGESPLTGPNIPLIPVENYPQKSLDDSFKSAERENPIVDRAQGKPISFFPRPTEADYKRGYLIRYFTKKENETIIIEVSESEYNDIQNGTTDYDIRIYQTQKILWKITGPLNAQRQSQYNVIPGIIDTNKRLTETANKTFLGILDFIGGDYTKFARPTA